MRRRLKPGAALKQGLRGGTPLINKYINPSSVKTGPRAHERGDYWCRGTFKVGAGALYKRITHNTSVSRSEIKHARIKSVAD